MTDHDHITEMIPAFALGSLDEHEAVLVSEHLAECASCRSELEKYQRVIAYLSFGVESNFPPEDVKMRLMGRVRGSDTKADLRSKAPKARRIARLLPVWGVVSILLIVGLALGNILLWQRISGIEENYHPGGMYTFPMLGTDVIPEAAGYVVIGADGMNGAMVVDKLPVLDSDQQYQLWLIRDGQYTSGAVFSVVEEGYGGRRVNAPQTLFEYSGVCVTIEPEGDNAYPSGKKVLTGTLFSP